MACSIDESVLPFLTGCPGPNEWIVVGNAVGGLDMNGGQTIGYGRRLWSSFANCILANLAFMFNGFYIGQAGDLIGVGGTTITLTYTALGITGILNDSVCLVLQGQVLPRNDSTQVSYSVSYNPTNVVITLNQQATVGQWYLLTYSYF